MDYRVFGTVPLEIYIQTKDQRFLDLGRSFADRQWETTTPDGITTEARYWIDDMFMITAVQVQAYRATGDRKYIDRAAKTMVAYLDKLQQPNGLFFHAPDSQFYWSRGNGWMAAGSAELLRSLPADHPARPRILEGYRKMMASLLTMQGEDGLWRQLLDHPEAWPETSGTGMFAFAMVTGVQERLARRSDLRAGGPQGLARPREVHRRRRQHQQRLRGHATRATRFSPTWIGRATSATCTARRRCCGRRRRCCGRRTTDRPGPRACESSDCTRRGSEPAWSGAMSDAHALRGVRCLILAAVVAPAGQSPARPGAAPHAPGSRRRSPRRRHAPVRLRPGPGRRRRASRSLATTTYTPRAGLRIPRNRRHHLRRSRHRRRAPRATSARAARRSASSSICRRATTASRVTLGDADGESLTTVRAESRRLMLEHVATARGAFATRTLHREHPQQPPRGRRLRGAEEPRDRRGALGRRADARVRRSPAGRRGRRDRAGAGRDDGVPGGRLDGDRSDGRALERVGPDAPALLRARRRRGEPRGVGREPPVVRRRAPPREDLRPRSRPGDYLFLQFAHNDQKLGSDTAPYEALAAVRHRRHATARRGSRARHVDAAPPLRLARRHRQLARGVPGRDAPRGPDRTAWRSST